MYIKPILNEHFILPPLLLLTPQYANGQESTPILVVLTYLIFIVLKSIQTS